MSSSASPMAGEDDDDSQSTVPVPDDADASLPSPSSTRAGKRGRSSASRRHSRGSDASPSPAAAAWELVDDKLILKLTLAWKEGKSKAEIDATPWETVYAFIATGLRSTGRPARSGPAVEARIRALLHDAQFRSHEVHAELFAVIEELEPKKQAKTPAASGSRSPAAKAGTASSSAVKRASSVPDSKPPRGDASKPVKKPRMAREAEPVVPLASGLTWDDAITSILVEVGERFMAERREEEAKPKAQDSATIGPTSTHTSRTERRTGRRTIMWTRVKEALAGVGIKSSERDIASHCEAVAAGRVAVKSVELRAKVEELWKWYDSGADTRKLAIRMAANEAGFGSQPRPQPHKWAQEEEVNITAVLRGWNGADEGELDVRLKGTGVARSAAQVQRHIQRLRDGADTHLSSSPDLIAAWEAAVAKPTAVVANSKPPRRQAAVNASASMAARDDPDLKAAILASITTSTAAASPSRATSSTSPAATASSAHLPPPLPAPQPVLIPSTSATAAVSTSSSPLRAPLLPPALPRLHLPTSAPAASVVHALATQTGDLLQLEYDVALRGQAWTGRMRDALLALCDEMDESPPLTAALECVNRLQAALAHALSVHSTPSLDMTMRRIVKNPGEPGKWAGKK